MYAKLPQKAAVSFGKEDTDAISSYSPSNG